MWFGENAQSGLLRTTKLAGGKKKQLPPKLRGSCRDLVPWSSTPERANWEGALRLVRASVGPCIPPGQTPSPSTCLAYTRPCRHQMPTQRDAQDSKMVSTTSKGTNVYATFIQRPQSGRNPTKEVDSPVNSKKRLWLQPWFHFVVRSRISQPSTVTPFCPTKLVGVVGSGNHLKTRCTPQRDSI